MLNERAYGNSSKLLSNEDKRCYNTV